MISMDTDLFLDDFEAEAKAHIEVIEAAFLDVASLVRDPKLMNNVFRTAHSLKGTAGFFFLEKIVSIAHELESVFSQIKDGNLEVDGEITDIVLQSVDCLRDLVDNINDEDAIDTAPLIETLKKYSDTANHQNQKSAKAHIPFALDDPETEKALKKATRYGHKLYYINVSFNRGLGEYYKHPEIMFDSILSIGSILKAIVNGNADEIISEQDPAAMAAKLINALAESDTSTLELLVASVLEFELFSIATEIDEKHIHPLSKELLLSANSGKSSEYPGSLPPAPTPPPGLPKAETGAAYIKTSENTNSSSIRLDISTITALVDLANEMILTRNRLNSAVTEHRKEIAGIMPILHDMNRLTSEIQERVMLTRMQPVSVVFGKFPRIIHDTAKALNKEIEIEILGGDVTLDKYLLDSLADPITQLVKNSADHGVERAGRRAALGKPQKGKITLNAYMRDGSAIIEIADDGAGIDVQALARKGLDTGILTEDALLSMSESEIFDLIFEPGFSTAKEVTNMSGRGVGMDIVKTNIEKLGGVIEIESEIGKGTTIRLKMPLTLSVLRILIVTIDSVRYAVPEINVERIVRIRGSMPSKRLERLNNSLVLSLDGHVLPLVTMEEIDAKAKGLEPPSAEALLERSLRRDVNKCLVLKTDDRYFALLIDDAIETEQTLVKPLPEFLKSCLCYSNVTVLGNGSAIAILSAEGILRLMEIEGASKADFSEECAKGGSEERQYIIFKCSGSEYYALETCEISRIETIDPMHIQDIGSANYINIAGETVRIIRPEKYIPVRTRRYTEEKLYMLTLKKSPSPMGFLVGKVLDKVEGVFELAHDQLCSEYIFGTGTFDEKVIIFLNPAAITEEIEKDKRRRGKIKKRGDA